MELRIRRDIYKETKLIEGVMLLKIIINIPLALLWGMLKLFDFH